MVVPMKHKKEKLLTRMTPLVQTTSAVLGTQSVVEAAKFARRPSLNSRETAQAWSTPDRDEKHFAKTESYVVQPKDVGSLFLPDIKPPWSSHDSF